jgi:hypothetical protein
MTRHAVGGRYTDMACLRFTAGWTGNTTPPGDLFTKMDRTNRAVARFADRNTGYKSDWRASLISRELSSTCSQSTIKQV